VQPSIENDKRSKTFIIRSSKKCEPLFLCSSKRFAEWKIGSSEKIPSRKKTRKRTRGNFERLMISSPPV
jgi:hypothetical protein